MFTGIVEELGIGRVARRPAAPPRRRRPCSTDVALGDSIAVNGCCLTVVDFGVDDWWEADVSDETFTPDVARRRWRPATR